MSTHHITIHQDTLDLAPAEATALAQLERDLDFAGLRGEGWEMRAARCQATSVVLTALERAS